MSTEPFATNSKRWWALGVLSIIQMMVALDVTVINLALPRAQVALHFTNANRQWLVTSYALAFGSLLLLGGRLCDLYGRRIILIISLTGFAISSGLGGLAHTFTTLVVARAFQGGFGAFLAPAALAVLTTTFTQPKERAKAFSIFGAIGGSGAAIGLLLGGALTQYESWRWCLFINVAFAVVALIGVFFFVENTKVRLHTQLDVLGMILGSGGLFLLVYGFGHAVQTSWLSLPTWGSLAGSVIAIWLFILWQQRAPSPLLPLRLIINRTRGGSLVGLFLTSIGIFGISLFLAYYMQNQLGYTPLRTGIYFLPMVLALGLSASVASARLLAKTGPRPLIPIGMLLAMMGMILFTTLPLSNDYLGHVLPGLVLTGLGLGLIFAPATASATAGIRPRDAGAASALVNTTQQIGGSIGTALLNTIAVSVTSRVLQFDNSKMIHVSTLMSNRATLHGFHVAFWWVAGFFGAGALSTIGLLESGVPDLEPDLLPLI